MIARLKSLELEGFRGFAKQQLIDLDADAVIVRGDNGTGKTSLVDGLLWLFCGELAYLAERVRGLRRAEDVVTNRFSTAGARVILTVDASGGEHVFARTGNQKNNRLSAHVPGGETVHEQEAELALARAFGVATGTEMQAAVLTWGLLRQDAIRSALDVTGGALHQRLAGLIGLERVSDFATAATRASEGLVRECSAARRSRDQAANRHKELLRRRDLTLQAAGSSTDLARLVGGGLDVVKEKLGGTVELTVDATADPSAVANLVEDIDRVVAALSDLHGRQRAFAAYPSDAEQLLATAEATVFRATEAASVSIERAPALTQLASAAVGLLGKHCPVCQQPIDEQSVRAHLEEILESSQLHAARLQEAEDELARARAELARVRGMLEERRIASQDTDVADVKLRTVLAESSSHLRLKDDQPDPSTVDALLERLRPALDDLRELHHTVTQISGAQVARLTDECEAAAEARDTAEEQLLMLEERRKRAKTLEHAAHDSAKTILVEALEALRPSFSEVFDRLAPNPAFTELLAEQDVLRNRNQIVPMVQDRISGVRANPQLVFSEGQLNVVALSYFLGMALNAREAALPFLILDDPIQALDVIAILGFSDLCRQVRDQRQLIVTTHDRRFADVMIRKLSPRAPHDSLIVHDCTAWGRGGPVIHTRRPEAAPVIRLLAKKAS